jgi:hypothetical protein
MRRAGNFFKARQNMAKAISERTFRACEVPQHNVERETVSQFLSRGGTITVLPPERSPK